MKKIIKKPYVVGLIVLLIGIIGYAYFGKNDAPEYETFIAVRTTVSQEVSVTGRVKPAQKVDLAFEKTGRIAVLAVRVGDLVRTGQTLATFENAETAAQLREAEADVRVQEAKLNELTRGTRPEELRVYEVKVANAEVALADAKRNAIDKIQDGYTKSDDATRNKVDQFFNNPRSANPQLAFSTSPRLESDIEWGRLLAERTLTRWRTSLNELTAAGDLAAYAADAAQNLDEIKSFLDKVASAVNGLTAGGSLSQTTIDTWKGDVATGRTNVNTAIVNLSAADEKLRAAASALTLAKEELALKKAGTVAEQITAQGAQVEKARANAEYYRAQLAKTALRAPLNGIVTAKNAEIGEIVAANATVVSLISETEFEIEANVPEADIAKIRVGDAAEVTLDAYGRDALFTATIVKIDPAETVLEGVATYKTTFQFSAKDPRIKSGMTANIDIAGERRENVVVIPQRAVARRNGGQFVKIVKKGTAVEVTVKTGLRGSDGTIEIIEGVREGDEVIVNGAH